MCKVFLCVCVCLSVTSTVSVFVCLSMVFVCQSYSVFSLTFLDFDSWILNVQNLWRKKELTVSRFRTVSGPAKHKLREGQLVGHGVNQARLL